MKAITLSVLLSLLCWPLAGHSATELNQPAPDFTLKQSGNSNYRLSEQKGDILLVNFWASWCGPCRQEMPELEALYSEFEDLGVQVVGINVEQDSSEGQKFLKDTPVSFPILWDSASQVSELYQVDAMPTTVLIDRDGNVRYHHRGYQPGYEKLYRKQLKKLIRE